MRVWEEKGFAVIEQTSSLREEIPVSFRVPAAEAPRRFHQTVKGYAVTPLVSLPALAAALGVKGIYAKDESKRFSLNAFKGLGGSYAMFRILCDRLGLDPESATMQELTSGENREKISQIEFVTCTDGNHGRGVSWAAGLFGCRAHVYMPCGTQEVRAEAIRQVWDAVKKYNPRSMGFDWDDSNPRIQLEPIGTRGYIELLPIKRI